MHRPLSILGRRATVALLILATGTAAGGGAQEPVALEPWTTQDVLDGRIDEYAQYALMRMFAQDPVAGAAASAMLSAVKSLELAGIYLPDQQVPALRARWLGKGWRQLLPGGADAVGVSEPGDEPPLIVFP